MDLILIRKLRKGKGLSIGELSIISEVSRFKIGRMENKGEGQYSEVVKVLSSLGYEIKVFAIAVQIV